MNAPEWSVSDAVDFVQRRRGPNVYVFSHLFSRDLRPVTRVENLTSVPDDGAKKLRAVPAAVLVVEAALFVSIG